ncbi:DUF378 domain-containing protein [Fredinandcohnia humi]
MSTIQRIALVLTIIGALNWGLIGLFQFDLVAALFDSPAFQRLIYSLVGLAGLINIGLLFKNANATERSTEANPSRT